MHKLVKLADKITQSSNPHDPATKRRIELARLMDELLLASALRNRAATERAAMAFTALNRSKLV